MKKVVLRAKGKKEVNHKKGKPEYKHRATLEFKGLQWRYDKTYGEWRPVKVKGGPKRQHLHTIDSTSFPRDGWRILGAWGGTPLEALKAYTKANIEMHQRDLKDLQDRVKEEKIYIRAMRSKSWA